MRPRPEEGKRPEPWAHQIRQLEESVNEKFGAYAFQLRKEINAAEARLAQRFDKDREDCQAYGTWTTEVCVRNGANDTSSNNKSMRVDETRALLEAYGRRAGRLETRLDALEVQLPGALEATAFGRQAPGAESAQLEQLLSTMQESMMVLEKVVGEERNVRIKDMSELEGRVEELRKRVASGAGLDAPTSEAAVRRVVEEKVAELRDWQNSERAQRCEALAGLEQRLGDSLTAVTQVLRTPAGPPSLHAAPRNREDIAKQVTEILARRDQDGTSASQAMCVELRTFAQDTAMAQAEAARAELRSFAEDISLAQAEERTIRADAIAGLDHKLDETAQQLERQVTELWRHGDEIVHWLTHLVRRFTEDSGAAEECAA